MLNKMQKFAKVGRDLPIPKRHVDIPHDTTFTLSLAQNRTRTYGKEEELEGKTDSLKKVVLGCVSSPSWPEAFSTWDHATWE